LQSDVLSISSEPSWGAAEDAAEDDAEMESSSDDEGAQVPRQPPRRSTRVFLFSNDQSCCWYLGIPLLIGVGALCLRFSCKGFFDPQGSRSHDGRHWSVQRGLLDKADKWLNLTRTVFDAIRGGDGRDVLLSLYCVKGRHRSVGAAEILAYLIDQLCGFVVHGLEHVSLREHPERACSCRGYGNRSISSSTSGNSSTSGLSSSSSSRI
jgi:hypothetical protein